MASHPVLRVAMIATLVSVALWAQSSTALAQAPQGTLQQKLADLNRQLGKGPNAEAWKSFLKLSELEAQLTAGDKADPAVVDSILARFSGTEKGLDWAPVVAVRQSLSAWASALPPPPATDLAKLLRDAKSKYVARSQADADSARAAVRTSLDQLNRYLASGPQGPGWRTFLYIEALENQLKSATPDVEELRQIQRQFVSGKVGLELPIFANVGRSLDTYVDRLTTVDSPKTREQFAAQLEALAAGVEKLQKDPTAEVTAAYEWLSTADQVRPLLAAVRHHYSKPNLHVDVSGKFMASRANRMVDDIGPVRDVILGTRISGTGHTRGTISLNLIPDNNRAVYELLFSGNVASTTVGRNGPAVIHSLGNTAFTARKRILLDSMGLSQIDASTQAVTSSKTTGVGVTIKIPIVKGIVRKIATQKVAEKKGQGNYIGARHAEVRINHRFDEEVWNNLASAHQKFQDVLVLPAKRYGQPSDQLHFSTTDSQLKVVGMHANRLQLAAPISPPAVDGADLAVRLHESTVNNLAESIAGQTWQDQHLKAQLAKVVEIPKQWEPESDEEKEPGTITFADEKPITLQIADGGATLTIRAQGFTRGEKQYEGMDISVTYKLAKSDKGVVLRRSGEIKVRPPSFVQGKDKLSLGQTTLVKLLEKTFGKIFTEEVSTDIKLDKDPARIETLVVTSHSADKGWLALGWNQQSPAAPNRTASQGQTEKPR